MNQDAVPDVPPPAAQHALDASLPPAAWDHLEAWLAEALREAWNRGYEAARRDAGLPEQPPGGDPDGDPQPGAALPVPQD